MFLYFKMKKYLFIIILLMANIFGQQNRAIGDINDDGEVNVIDVVLLVSNILDDTVNENADINQDDFINVLDVVLLVDMILNQENIPEIGLFVSQQYEEDELTFFYDIEYSQRPNPYGVQYSSSRTQQEEMLQDTIFLH
ncbi:MAG: hypothetical protein CMG09_05370, partial [Candidatus Marinimicrobia bacterium]|nr:hypothetical protein [Candidatus Neomarinimicrobiota bacterium]